jgi:hydrogenase expression/formation protein HypD
MAGGFMKFQTEFQDRDIAQKILEQIKQAPLDRQVSLMEVCGTHTVAIFRHGIKNLLPKNIRLISGPGCPVCVTDLADIDRGIEIAKLPQVIFASFGDMLKVPGSRSSLLTARAEGADVRIVYSCLDALKIARKNPEKDVVFFGIGFETTSPTIAATVAQAKEEGVNNFFILSSFKLLPPALTALLADEDIKVDGFLLPGHVCTIIGSEILNYVAEKYKTPGVIAGFEPVDILGSVLMLVRQIENNTPEIKIAYRRSVHPEGNRNALALLDRVFETSEATWRGIGNIPESGLKLRKDYEMFGAEKRYDVKIENVEQPTGCRCAEVLKGMIDPPECKLFRHGCNPEKPLGSCMVSSEGTCATWYKYGG